MEGDEKEKRSNAREFSAANFPWTLAEGTISPVDLLKVELKLCNRVVEDERKESRLKSRHLQTYIHTCILEAQNEGCATSD